MNTQLVIVSMLLSGLIALWGLKLQKKNKGLGIFISVIFSVLTIALAGQQLWLEVNRDALYAAKIQRVTEAQGEVLGAHIASTYPDARVLILQSPKFPGVESGSFEQRLLAGIRKGLPSSQIVGEQEIPIPQKVLNTVGEDGSEEQMEMLMYEIYDFGTWFTADSFDQYIAEHRNSFDILLTLSALPDDLENSKALVMEDAPSIVAAGFSNVDLDPFIRKGRIVATIAPKRGDKGPSMADVKLPASSQEIFDLWHEIVTPSNVLPDATPAKAPAPAA